MAFTSAARRSPNGQTERKFHPTVTPTHDNVPGQIKWFNSGKGYGFIVCDGIEGDVFLPQPVLQQIGLTKIEDGRRVSVSFGKGPKGFSATAIKLA